MKLRFSRIAPGMAADFTCEDPDLQEFFRNDWMAHEEQLFAVTYGFFHEETCVAMLSVANDRVDANEVGKTEDARREALAAVPPSKQAYRHYPAVKLARLGIAKGYRGQGIGTFLLSFLKFFFVIHNKTGCRYMTVDSYPESEGFYSGGKRGFQVLPHRRSGANVPLFFDLLFSRNALESDPGLLAEYEESIRRFAANGNTIELEI